LINEYAIGDFYSAFHYGANCFYIIMASPAMQKQVADYFMAENVAVYDYSGKANRYLPNDIFKFIKANPEKEVLFILNFQIPFLGKEPDPEQPDYFALNFYRDVLNDYNKKIFFFMTKETEYNIFITTYDFYDYCLLKIGFEDEKKDEIKLPIQSLSKEYDKAEIEYRLNRYKEQIEEYVHVDIYNYCTVSMENENILIPIDKKSENYLLIAARDLDYFAGLYGKINDFCKALELSSKALAIREKILGIEHFNTAKVYNTIGYVYNSLGNYSYALEYYLKALKILGKALGKEHPDVATLYNNIGGVYASQGDYPKALEYRKEALAMREKMFGSEHPDVVRSYNDIGAVYIFQGDYSKALEYYLKALLIGEKVFGNEHSDVATLCDNIGYVYSSQADYPNALEYFNRALKIRKTAVP